MLLKQNQQKTCSLCGHRILYSAMKIEKRLFQEIENLIKDGCSIFKIGTHGAFDQLALSVCRQLKTQYPHIKIQVVFTSLSAFVKDEYGFCLADLYKDVETITYPIEDVYFKKQITMCNRMMINDYENNITLKQQIKELKEMLDEGLIGQDEYEQKKKQILKL